jgi:hypothetical protein
LGMLREDRIPDAQPLPIGWIIPEDAQLIVRRADMLLPPELVMKVEPREPPEYPERVINWNPGPPSVTVEAPGFLRVSKGYGVREIERLTGVKHETQTRIKDGKRVRPDVVRRLASGLGVDVDELLRRG